MYDELLWSKRSWNDYKLEFPYHRLKVIDPEFVNRYQNSLEDGKFTSTSLDGSVEGDVIDLIEKSQG